MITGCVECRSSLSVAFGEFGGEIDDGRGGTGGNDEGYKTFGAVGRGGGERVGGDGNVKLAITFLTFGVS